MTFTSLVKKIPSFLRPQAVFAADGGENDEKILPSGEQESPSREEQEAADEILSEAGEQESAAEEEAFAEFEPDVPEQDAWEQETPAAGEMEAADEISEDFSAPDAAEDIREDVQSGGEDGEDGVAAIKRPLFDVPQGGPLIRKRPQDDEPGFPANVLAAIGRLRDGAAARLGALLPFGKKRGELPNAAAAGAAPGEDAPETPAGIGETPLSGEAAAEIAAESSGAFDTSGEYDEAQTDKARAEITNKQPPSKVSAKKGGPKPEAETPAPPEKREKAAPLDKKAAKAQKEKAKKEKEKEKKAAQKIKDDAKKAAKKRKDDEKKAAKQKQLEEKEAAVLAAEEANPKLKVKREKREKKQQSKKDGKAAKTQKGAKAKVAAKAAKAAKQAKKEEKKKSRPTKEEKRALKLAKQVEKHERKLEKFEKHASKVEARLNRKSEKKEAQNEVKTQKKSEKRELHNVKKERKREIRQQKKYWLKKGVGRVKRRVSIVAITLLGVALIVSGVTFAYKSERIPVLNTVVNAVADSGVGTIIGKLERPSKFLIGAVSSSIANIIEIVKGQPGFEDMYFFEADKQARYEAYQEAHPRFTADEVVWRVNSSADLLLYQDVVEITDFNKTPIVINKFNHLPKNYEPAGMIPIEGTGMQANPAAYDAFLRMQSDAEAAGLALSIASAYRSYEYQQILYNPDVGDTREALVSHMARPGFSEHQSGLAFDLVAADGRMSEFGGTPEADWISENAWKYGFLMRYPEDQTDVTGVPYEPWHIRYVGDDVVNTMRENDIETLEEYKVKYLDHKIGDKPEKPERSSGMTESADGPI